MIGGKGSVREVVVGFLGCGNIGCGVYTLLSDFASSIEHRSGVRFRVKRALVRNIQKQRNAKIPAELLTTNPDDVLCDPEIQLVVEFLGGEQPATAYMLRAMDAGKTVITANKLAVASNWHLLQAAAARQRVGLYFEASVCGGIPVIRAVTDSLQANRIDEVYGIINGTTNYILSRMAQEGLPYQDVLFDAQRLGLAEPDPSSDVNGDDAAYKLSILSSLAFHARVPVSKVFKQGITSISPIDIAYGREMGYVVKLLAIAKRKDQLVQARVHPTLVPVAHPLASVSDAFNAVFLRGHACGDMMFYGRGAGDMPTASALVSDMIIAAGKAQHELPSFYNAAEPPSNLFFDSDWESRYFIRVSAEDKPGVLSAIAGSLAHHDVSIASMRQIPIQNERVPLIFMTHVAREQALRAALEDLPKDVATVENVIYVEDIGQ